MRFKIQNLKKNKIDEINWCDQKEKLQKKKRERKNKSPG
jgi:hypothetical protein